jgi:signal transduction histidine kinase/DNA-binding response OmpR family regulator/ligand-binding sensor domain-containing protein
MRTPAFCFVLLSFSILSVCGCGSETSSGTSEVEPQIIISDNISNQNISVIAEDAGGYVWFGTPRGLNRYNGYNYHQYFSTSEQNSLPSSVILDLYVSRDSTLWVGTSAGICRYTDKGDFERIEVEGDSKYISHIEESSSGELFASSANFLLEYDRESNVFRRRLPFDPGTWIIGFHSDKYNRVWLRNGRQMECRDAETLNLITRLDHELVYNSSLFDNGWLWMSTGFGFRIYDTNSNSEIEVASLAIGSNLFRDDAVLGVWAYDSSSVLIATRLNGLFLYNMDTDQLVSETDSTFPIEVPDSEITDIYVDSRDNIWIGTLDKSFAAEYSYSRQFNNNIPLTSFFAGKSVISISKDAEGGVWFLTRHHGLFYYDREGNISRVEYERAIGKRATLCFADTRGQLWLCTDIEVFRCRVQGSEVVVDTFDYVIGVNCLMEDKYGTVWLGATGNSIYCYRGGQGQPHTVRLFDTDERMATYDILALQNSDYILCASSYAGLTVVRIDDYSVEEHIDLTSLPNQVDLSTTIPTTLYQDAQGEVWIGTIGGGVLRYDPRTGIAERFEGMACDDISTIARDADGNILIGTLDGLSKYNVSTGGIQNYTVADGIGGQQFNERATVRLPDNTLVLGNTNGITLYNPSRSVRTMPVRLYFEDLYVDNRLSLAYGDNNIATRMSTDPDVNINHHSSSFSVSFAALDYGEFSRVHYRYMLEGYDRTWHEAQHDRQAIYIHLFPGRYRLLVEAKSNSSDRVESTGAIDIRIHPAWWESGFALFVCYPLLVLALLWGVVDIRRRNRRAKDAIAEARREKDTEKKINRMNMQFFSNVSHEFRTPLMMIAGPLSMLEQGDETSGNRKLLGIVRRNVNRMLRLVNQMMDFGKLDEDVLKLRVVHDNVVGTLRRTLEIFHFAAGEKGIALTWSGLDEPYAMWFDDDKVDKIVFNLLSNAFKFTPAGNGGAISLDFDVVPAEEVTELAGHTGFKTYAKITVSDNGIGIPEEKLESVFERYSQIENQQLRKNYGTGIGLYYAKRLALLHHGNIVAQQRAGGGSVFILVLPVDEGAYGEAEKVVSETGFVSEHRELPALQNDSDAGKTEGAVKHTILLVEDDSEVVNFLQTVLSPHFNVIARFDAGVAYGELEQLNPDLVITDVSMPGMDGYQFCNLIKENMTTSHLPVIMLTARSMVSEQVKGLESGADAYVVKPFEPSYLLALIKSNIANREKIRSLLGSTTQIETIDKANVELSAQDRIFMTRLYEIMENELSMPELNVARITEQLKISRSKFYYKFKSLLNDNPNAFFRTYKLNRSLELLKTGKYNISEISDMTGFSSLSHFSSSFKKHFGVAPSEYGKASK